jgi:DNA-directed RNA polymerase subunit M/transcription elongation factor TFIIS
MKFCDNCGTYLRETKEGLWCPRCKKVICTKPSKEFVSVRKASFDAVYVVDGSEEVYEKVSSTCPKCGNGQAIHWFSTVTGEHAGIRRERVVEHFKCTKCSHSWSESF